MVTKETETKKTTTKNGKKIRQFSLARIIRRERERERTNGCQEGINYLGGFGDHIIL